MKLLEDVRLNTDELSLTFVGADAEAEVLAAEMELELMVADGDGSGVTVHSECPTVWLRCNPDDDASLDEAIEIFRNYVVEYYGLGALEAALESAGQPKPN